MDKTEYQNQIEEIINQACSDLSSDDFWIFMMRIKEIVEEYE